MIDVERHRVGLDLGDDLAPLLLWYPNRALVAISKKISVDLPLARAYDVLAEHLTAQTLAIYIWAGRIWQERNTRLEDIANRVDDAPLPINKIIDAIADAMFRSIYGKTPDEALAEVKEAAKKVTDPQTPPASLNGAGNNASSSPLASSDYP